MLVSALSLCESTGFEAAEDCAKAQLCNFPLKSHSCLIDPCVCSPSLYVCLHSLVFVPELSACALSPALVSTDICPSPQQ